jgi:hypothetical protein
MKIKAKFSVSNVYKIVADGAIATQHTADGRLIPVLILKNENNNNLESLIKIHADTPGDAQSMWAKQRFNSKTMFLIFKFKKPLEVEMIIEFDLSKHHILVDAITCSNGVYLQLGDEGDNVSKDVNAPKILVEVPSGTIIDNWDKTLRKIIIIKLLKSGFSRQEAFTASIEHIARQRELCGARFKRPSA